MPEGVGYGLGAMQGQQQVDPLDAQFQQAAEQDPGQAGHMFRSLLIQRGIDPNMPLAKQLTPFVATGGMDVSVALQRLGMLGGGR
jgi:hypothetical protein